MEVGASGMLTLVIVPLVSGMKGGWAELLLPGGIGLGVAEGGSCAAVCLAFVL